MHKYYRVCEGLNSKGVLISKDDNPYKLLKDPNKDYYISLYRYNDKHKKHFQELGSISGITDTMTSQLLWDFDNKESFDEVRKDTLELIKRLASKGVSSDNIEIFFSGNKGTHVRVFLDRDITPKEFKLATQSLAQNLKTYDSSVSNPSRIIRISGTKHQKTALYKIPLTLEEVESLSIHEIKAKAKTNNHSTNNVNDISLPNELFTQVKKEKIKKETVKGELDYTKKPKWLSHWKYALLNGYFPPGTRSNALMILASTYKAQGMPKEVTYHSLKGAAELQAGRFNEEKFCKKEIYNNIINQVYSPLWNGGTYSEDSFPVNIQEYLIELGVPRQEELVEDDQIENISSGFEDFVDYAKDIEKYTMKFGIPALDEKLKVRKGHLIGLIAAPGVGKTTWALSLLNNMSKKGTHGYFGSYDMFKHNVYQKLIQRHSGVTEDQLFDDFVNKNTNKIDEYRKILIDNYENVSFCFKVGQTVEDLKSSIRQQEEKTGRPIELVIVDYLELILTKASDPTAASAEAAQGLREITNDGKVVIMLLQPNKMSSKPNEPVLSYSAAKGSSSIAQAATAILTAHRPGLSSENPENDQFFSINCVKNRNGALFALDFGWKGSTQTIYELDDIEKMELENVRALVREEKKDSF